MIQTKAPNNRIIELTEEKKNYYSKKLLDHDFISKRCFVSEILDSTINADFYDIWFYLPHSFIDLLIVDPPYNLSKKFGISSFSKLKDIDYKNWMDTWFSKIYKMLKPNASIYICSDWKISPIVYSILRKYVIIRNRITKIGMK